MYLNGSEILKECVAKMALKNSYWGYLFSTVRRIPDENLPSIMGISPEKDCTISLRFHPELVKNTEIDVLKLVLEHEGMHLLNKHIPRLIRILADEYDDSKKMIKSQVWNHAADCCVNSQIKDFPRTLKINNKDWSALFPSTYKLPNGKATEWYYNKLLEKDEVKKALSNSEQSGKKGQETDCTGQGLSNGNPDIGDHSKWSSGGEESLDDHTYARRIENFTQDVVKRSLKHFNKNKGNLPGGILELIDDLLQPPKAPYYQIISKLVKATRLTKFQRCPTRVNRKRAYTFILQDLGFPNISPFPGKKRDYTFDIGVLIDTSGSQSKEDILDALSGIKNLIECDRYCKVYAIEIDTKVQKEYEIKKLSDIQMSVKGRGGTILFPGLERFKELSVDVVLAFTDGYCDNINEIDRKKLPKKIIWAIDKERGTTSCVNQTGYIVRI